VDNKGFQRIQLKGLHDGVFLLALNVRDTNEPFRKLTRRQVHGEQQYRSRESATQT
jgi:hypothetical protein